MPKSGNFFAALSGVSDHPGSPGARDAKKKARAAEHRRTQAAQSPSPGPSLPPGTPFFTLAVEGPHTAVALDADGAELASLHFDDFDDLTSDSFREYAAAAVAAVTASASASAEGAAAAGDDDVIDLTSDGDGDGSEDAFYDVLDQGDYGGDEGGGALDFDAEFAAALAEAAHAADGSEEGAGADVNADADLALALALQEEEEAAAAAEAARRVAGSAWARPPPAASFSSVLGPRVPACGAPSSAPAVGSEFPVLGPLPSAAAGLAGRQQQQRVPLRVAMAASRARGVRVVNSTAPAPGPRGGGWPGGAEPAAPAVLPYLPGFVRADDQLARPSDFLNSVGEDAVQARAEALRWARQSAEREGGSGGGGGGSGGGGLDSATVKRMMDSSAGARPPSSASSRSLPGAAAGGAGPRAEEEGEPERGLYCRKSIRKLVLDMIAAGWEPLWGRGGGHLVYQRIVPPTGHKQLLVLPCTPSDRKSIEATHARLQRMDREAAEVRRRAAAAAAAAGGGG